MEDGGKVGRNVGRLGWWVGLVGMLADSDVCR